MANSIMDVINKYQEKTAQTAAPIQTSIATGGSGVIRQNLNLQAAQAQKASAVMNSAADTSAEGKLLDEQRKQSNIQRDDQVTQLGQQRDTERQSYAQKSQSIIDNLKANKDQLSSAERMDQMQAAGTFLRLQDDKYRYQLADIGRRQRLDDANGFDDALKSAIFSNQSDLLRNNLSFKNMLDADDATFRKSLQDMDTATALKVAGMDAASIQSTATWSAGAKAAGAGAGYVAKNYKSTTTDTTDTSGQMTAGNPTNQPLNYNTGE